LFDEVGEPHVHIVCTAGVSARLASWYPGDVSRLASSRARRTLLASCALLIGSLLAALTCEAALWTLHPTGYEQWRRASLTYLLDDLAYWKLEPRSYDWGQVNRRALRGPLPIVPKPNDVYRILVLGGSAAFDLYKRDDATWSMLLQRNLGTRAGKRVEVVNAGTPGYSTYQVVPQLEHALADMQPDLVLLYELYNDSMTFRFRDRSAIERGWRINARGNYLCTAAHPGSAWDTAGALLPHTVDFTRLLWINQIGRPVLQSVADYWHRPALGERATDEGLALYAQNLDRIATLAEQRGATFGIITQATILREQTNAEQERWIRYDYRGMNHAALWDAYQRAWRETVPITQRHRGAFVIPAHLAIDPLPRFFHDEVHLTAEGSARLARIVADGLRGRVWADAM
jgi:lysophospholipase L1-like esterase